MTSSNQPFEFEDVLDALMLEESKPSYAALLRWSERYPQYRQELADFFATWAVQAERPQDVALDEEKLVDMGVRYALEISRRQGRVAPTSSIEPLLQPFDQLVLTAIYLLRGEAWSANIVDKVSEMSGTRVRFGPVFSSLQRLTDRRLVSVRSVHLKTQAEGGRRRYFVVTRPGEHALAQAKETSKVVAAFLVDFA